MRTLLSLFIIAGFCVFETDQQPCPGHVECASTTQKAYTVANGDVQKQCKALYHGLNCMETAVCSSSQTIGLQEAISFARRELKDLKCTEMGTSTTVPSEPTSACPQLAYFSLTVSVISVALGQTTLHMIL